MGFIKEFKQFALRGNAIDMAVGIIIGAAFFKIVESLVRDIIMPLVGLFLGGVDFSKLSYVLKDATPESKVVILNFGSFIQASVDFLIVAFAVFMMIKAMNMMMKKTRR